MLNRSFAPSALLSLAGAVSLAGCLGSSPSKSDQAASAPPPQQATAPSKSAPASRTPPGMNANGEVVDVKLVEGGHGQKVKGLGDWEGEITGKPAPGSKFTKLQIGMGMKQVTDIVGQPTDQGSYITGKAFIPWFWGSDRYRHEMVYKGQGRLIFAGGGVGDYSSGHLIWIIHYASETGYR